MMALRTRQPPVVHEGSLVEACRRGDRAALERVLGAEAPVLKALLLRLLGPGPLADDVLQDTLESAIVAFPGYRAEAPVAAWLTRIAVRTSFRHLRERASTRGDRRSAEEAPEPRDPGALPEHAVESRRALRATYRHLAELAPKRRIAFVLHVFEGRTIAEVAALVGATEVATRSRIFLARRELVARARRDPELRDRVSTAASAAASTGRTPGPSDEENDP